MTYLEHYYEKHPYPFFIVHMAAIFAFLIAVVSGIIMGTSPAAHVGAHNWHTVSVWVFFALFIIGALEAVIVKIRGAGKSDRESGFRYKWLRAQGRGKDAAVYAAHCIISWVVLPLSMVLVMLSGFTWAGALHSAHPVLGIIFAVIVVCHAVLSVPARRLRREVDKKLAESAA